jgi:putative endonuclease
MPPNGRAIDTLRRRHDFSVTGDAAVWGWLSRFWPRPAVALPLGLRGEIVASQHLQRIGYRVLERQLRGRFGELDLVAMDDDVVVFVEVKTRTSTAAGHPTEAVTETKQRKITQSALEYLKRRGWLGRRSRFDVVSIVWPDDDSDPELHHYRNAFEAFGHGQMFS